MNSSWGRIRTALASSDSPWPWIAIAALATLPHLGVILNPFAYDDWNSIVQNSYLRHPQALRKFFGGSVWDFLGPAHIILGNYYRPLMHSFHYFLYRLFGFDPAWFHLFCLTLHAGVSLLVAGVVRRLSGRHAVGMVAGLMFAVHPAHTEVVAWISCSPELLSSLFSLLAFWLYLRAVEAYGLRRALLTLAMGGSLLLAQLSKEIGVLMPVVILAYEFLVRRLSLRRQLQQRWPEYSALSAATLLYLVMRVHALGGLLPVPKQIAVPWTEQLWTSVALFYRYLVLLLWPMELIFFRYYEPNRSPLEPAVVAGWLSLAGFAGLAVWLYRRRLPEALAPAMYLLPLLPVFQLPYIFTGLLMIERAAYLPSVAFCWLLAAGLVKLAERRGVRTATVLAVLVLAAYTGRSATRMDDWRDEVNLFREGLAHAPASFHLHLVGGEALLRQQKPLEAAAALREALRLRPGHTDIHNSLGQAYWLLGQQETALVHYRYAAELSLQDNRPDSAARAWYNIGIVYRSQERNREAIAAYQQALQLDPEFAAARNNLGFALLLEGEVAEAARQLRAAIQRDPTLGQAHANLGLAYAMRGQWGAALATLAQAERLSPNNPEVHARIGEIHLARGEARAAQRRFWRALQLHPQNARALAGMAALRAHEAQP